MSPERVASVRPDEGRKNGREKKKPAFHGSAERGPRWPRAERRSRSFRAAERDGGYIIGSQRSGPVVPVGTRQTSPPLQTSSSQQGWPAAPQAWQVPVPTPPTQAWPARQASPRLQQRWPAAPQAWQVWPVTPASAAPPRQRRFGWQLSPAQQAPPAAPQVLRQVPGTAPGGSSQPRPVSQTEPGQQAWLSAPHARQNDCIIIPGFTQSRPWLQGEGPTQHS
jgi:hypothetical protein